MNRKWPDALREKLIMRIPGVGPSIARDLIEMGYESLEALKDQDRQAMYDKHCQIKGCQVDRCMLYVFRCAVYFVSQESHETEKLKWWNWKD